tara:strand:+ start:1746 stop:2165 length:420 start_codon:yes stop_codon:yes gene_type:complete
MNDRQKSFCNEYIVDLNSAQAAIRAGYSAKTARTIGSKLLTNIDIQDAIRLRMDERSESTGITADYVITGIKELTDKLVLGEDPKAAYKGFELLGKHLALFTEKLDHQSSDGSMSQKHYTPEQYAAAQMAVKNKLNDLD